MEGHQPYLGDLLTMVINHLLTGMILQVEGIFITVEVTFDHLGRGDLSMDYQFHLFRWNFTQVSNEKNLGWLGYIGDYTTQLYRDYNKPL